MATKRRKSHKDVEFAVGSTEAPTGPIRGAFYERTFGGAAERAVILARHGVRGKVTIDVIVNSVSGARWWGGDAAARRFRDYPEASVFERIIVRADSKWSIR